MRDPRLLCNIRGTTSLYLSHLNFQFLKLTQLTFF